MNRNEWIEYQRQLPKIDTHEHFSPEEWAVRADTDIFDALLTPYNCDTMWTAGCSRQEWAMLMDKKAPFEQRYKILEKYLPLIRYTAFFRAVEKTLELEFEEKDLSCEALLRADSRLKQQRKQGYYKKILDSLNIETVFCCSGYSCASLYKDPRVRFIPTVSEILPRNRSDLLKLETIAGIHIVNLETCLRAVDALFEKYISSGVCAVKFGSAYRRTLLFENPDYQSAEHQLNNILNLHMMGDAKSNGSKEPCRQYEELTALDDYLTDYILMLSEKFNLTVIFHVAMHAWNENDPERAHAHYLCNLIQKYSNVKFVLLHTGAPFFEEAVLLARYYANVYLDLTWFHIISPDLVRQAVIRILELVPVNKIFAFGGDYCYLETLPGHLEMAMENYAEVFCYICGKEICTEDQAKEILYKWYFENPKKIFRIKKENQKKEEHQE